MSGNKLGKKRSMQVPLRLHPNQIDSPDSINDLPSTELQTCGTQQARK
jgi:hypothetical protein